MQQKTVKCIIIKVGGWWGVDCEFVISYGSSVGTVGFSKLGTKQIRHCILLIYFPYLLVAINTTNR